MTAQTRRLVPVDRPLPRVRPLAGKLPRVAIVHDWLEVYAGAERGVQVELGSGLPAIEDALHIMILSYGKLNQPQLAEDTKRVLAGTFPDSPYVTGHSRPGAKKSWWQF